MRHEVKIGDSMWDIETPALVVDLDAMECNIAKMAAFFADKSAKLRPHCKTHKTPEIARKQMEAGAIGITCAKLGEAEVMAESGIRDILIANQIVGRQKIARLVELAKKADVMVAVDNPRNVQELSEAAQANGVTIRVLVEVDVGMKRCGVEPGEPAVELARLVDHAPNLKFMGLMGYEGHVVANPDNEVRRTETLKSLNLLAESKRALEEADLPVRIISGGGTGTYNITGLHPDVTEVQAGSYVFMDVSYRKVTPEFECALTVLSTVISKNPGRLMFDAGRKAIMDDHGIPEVKGHPEIKLIRLSEEHGRCVLEGSTDLDVGDKAELIVSHCCTTVNLHDRLYGVRDGKVEAIWQIKGRGRFD